MRLVHVYLLFVLQTQLFLQITYGISKSACPECGSGWVRLEDDPVCYKHTKQSSGKDYAFWSQYCQDEGASLPILKMVHEREQFKSLAPVKSCVFLGLHKDSRSSGWMWSDKDNTPITVDDLNNFLINGSKWQTSQNAGASTVFYDSRDGGYGACWISDACSDVVCQKHCPADTTPAGLGTGVIIGIAAGGAVLLLLLIIAAVVLVKRKRAAGIQQGEQSGTAKDDPGAGIATKDLFCGTEADHGIGTKDLFCGTEADQTGIGTKELFNATEADNASNASLHLQSVDK